MSSALIPGLKSIEMNPTPANYFQHALLPMLVLAVLLLPGCGATRPVPVPVLQPAVNQGTIGLWAKVILRESALRDLAQEDGQSIVVTRTIPGGPADRAGIKPGDILLKVDRTILESSAVAMNVIQNAVPGSHLSIKFQRGGKKFETVVDVEQIERESVAYRRPQEIQDTDDPPPGPSKGVLREVPTNAGAPKAPGSAEIGIGPAPAPAPGPGRALPNEPVAPAPAPAAEPK